MNRLIFRSLIAAFMLVLMFGVPSIASADGITWDLSGVTFDDGGTATGSFVYDALTDTYSHINVTTTPGTSLPGATYMSLSYLAGASNTGLTLGASSGDLMNTSLLVLIFDMALTNSGGKPIVLSLHDTVDDIDNSIEYFCTTSDPECSIYSGRYVTGGEVVPVPSVATPEPSAILLLGMGLIILLLGAMIRKELYF